MHTCLSVCVCVYMHGGGGVHAYPHVLFHTLSRLHAL